MVCTPGLIIRTEGVSTCIARLAVFRTQVCLARITPLCMSITGDSVTDTALDTISLTDFVTAGGTRFEMISTERFGTQVTGVSVSRASNIVTIRTESGVVSTNDAIADSTLSTVSSADFLPARVTRC